MYPKKELKLLADQTLALRRLIAVRRILISADFHRATLPLAALDRMQSLWGQVSPFAKLAAVPLGLFASRNLFPRRNLFGFLLRWTPAALALLRARRVAAATIRR